MKKKEYNFEELKRERIKYDKFYLDLNKLVVIFLVLIILVGFALYRIFEYVHRSVIMLISLAIMVLIYKKYFKK